MKRKNLKINFHNSGWERKRRDQNEEKIPQERNESEFEEKKEKK